MHTTNDSQESKRKSLVWYLLGEYSLSEYLPNLGKGDRSAAQQLSQMVRKLGMPVEWVENIEMVLRSLSKEALAHSPHGKVELCGQIRIFCQKKRVDEDMKGGWGYFVIERSTGVSTIDCTGPHHLIDFYFYKEGE